MITAFGGEFSSGLRYSSEVSGLSPLIIVQLLDSLLSPVFSIAALLLINELSRQGPDQIFCSNIFCKSFCSDSGGVSFCQQIASTILPSSVSIVSCSLVPVSPDFVVFMSKVLFDKSIDCSVISDLKIILILLRIAKLSISAGFIVAMAESSFMRSVLSGNELIFSSTESFDLFLMSTFVNSRAGFSVSVFA